MSARRAPADLAVVLRHALHGRVVVLGIGNPWRGDDAVGSTIAQVLRDHLQATSSPASDPITVLDAEEVPESWLGPAVAARPDVVLLIDAVELHAPPGATALFTSAELSRAAHCTHRTPLGPVADYLTHETGAEVLLLGVQPGSLEWGEQLSPAVATAAADLVVLLTAALGDVAGAAPPAPEAIAC